MMMIGSTLLSGLGSYLGNRSNRDAAQAQERFRRMLMGEFGEMRDQGPGSAENFLANLLMNQSQDGLFQMLRRSPDEQRDNAIEANLLGLADDGDPFDLSELFGTLGVQDARRRDEGLGAILAGGAGLGERFGTAMNLGASDFLARSGENEAARNAGIAMGSHESAQARRMGALQQLMQMTQNERGQQNIVAQLILQAVNSLGGMESTRRGQDANLLGMMAGGAPQGVPSYGGTLGDMGSLLIMLPMLMQIMGGGSAGQPVPQTGGLA